ncbi:hypothetical protein ACFE04_000762 [Oxalis oulophora]
MMVTTYSRRSDRPPLPIIDLTSLSSSSQETSQDFYNLSSQESNFHCSQQQDPFQFNEDPFSSPAKINNTKRKRESKYGERLINNNKKKKKEEEEEEGFGYRPLMIPATSTLMETQEFGEMMEHVDEVNFAMDGLKEGQPVRIRRASLLSLLSICGTTQRRRVLRSHGMAKTIIDAVLGIRLDDSSCNMAAAALFYVLSCDGQDERLLESPRCIRFLIKCLKPISFVAAKDKTKKIGSKLLALCKDADFSRDVTKMSDSSCAAIVSEVQDILISCKEMKSNRVADSGVKRPELDAEWIALLTLEKGCLSKISFEDTGTVRKTGGNFKEVLRELGGLDAVFEVTLKCHSEMKVWLERNSSSIQGLKDNLDLQNLSVLLKCLKIMENATFLSNDNQSHLLEMEGNLYSHGSRITFMQLVMSIIKTLSGRCMRKSSASSSNNKPNCHSNGTNHASELALIVPRKVASNEPILISSSQDDSSVEFSSSERSYDMCWDSTQSSTISINDSCSQELRVSSTMFTSASDIFTSSRNGILVKSNGSTKASSDFGLDKENQDPFAFNGGDFEPSKWDVLAGKKTMEFGAPKSKPKHRRRKVGCERPLTMINKLETSSRVTCLHESREKGFHHAREICCPSSADDEEISSLLDDCLLTAVKVLMNLTNDNTVGCQKIALCGVLETMCSLIARHFPLFSSFVSYCSEKKDSASSVLDQKNDKHLTDQELDFLVAILGLLVNLVEKDGHNRSQLASAIVSIRNSEGLEEPTNVIPLLCSVFIANLGAGDPVKEGNELTWNDEEAVLQGEKEAEKMIIEAYSALLLAFLSTESMRIRDAITECLPHHNLGILVPVLERFVAFHLTLNMISPETHKAVSEVIESCKGP